VENEQFANWKNEHHVWFTLVYIGLHWLTWFYSPLALLRERWWRERWFTMVYMVFFNSYVKLL
jgi:hypothetical protein